MVGRMFPSGGLRRKSIFFSFSASRGCILWVLVPSSIFKEFHASLCLHCQVPSPCLTFMPLSYKDSREYFGATQIIPSQDPNLVTFAKSLLSCKVALLQVLRIRTWMSLGALLLPIIGGYGGISGRT